MKTTLRQFLASVAGFVVVSLLAGCAPQFTQSNRTETSPTAPAPATDAAIPATNSPALRRVLPAPASVPPGVAEVITLVQAGVEESVVKAHMARSTNAFNPSVEELIYLNDIGIPGALVSSLIQQAIRQREQAALLAAAQANQPPAQVLRSPAPEVRGAAPPQAAPAEAAQPAPAAAAQPAPVVVAAPQPQQVVVVQPQLPVHVTHFYNTLSPYGTWVEIAPYGWCWQPTVAVSSPRWRPYLDRGRWLWTSSGWYWQSDYSWGWAPFHYGRWVLTSRVGWAWVPDLTWGPAWVTWRYSDSYCGWAPLPPGCDYFAGRGLIHRGVTVGITFDFGLASSHFSFVSWRRFCDRNPYYYVEPGTRQQVIYNQTTIINNYGSGSGNTIVNNGVPVARVQALTRTELQEVLIKEAPIGAGNIVKADRLEKAGSQLVIYKPQLQGPQPNAGIPAGAVPVFARGSNGPVVTGYTTDPVSIATGIPVVAGGSGQAAGSVPAGVPLTAGASKSPSGTATSTPPQSPSATPSLTPVTTPAPVPQVATPGHVRQQPITRPTAQIPVKTSPAPTANPAPSAGTIVKPEAGSRTAQIPFTIPAPRAIPAPSPRASAEPAPELRVPSVPSRVTTPGSSAPVSPAPSLIPAQPAPQPRPSYTPAPTTPAVTRPQPPSSTTSPVTTPTVIPPQPRSTPSLTPAQSRPSVPTPAPVITPSLPTTRPTAPVAAPAPSRSQPAQAGPTLAPSAPTPASPSTTPTSKSDLDKKR